MRLGIALTRIMLVFCALSGMIAMTSIVFAEDIDTAWIRTYDGPAGLVDIFYDVDVDASGNSYATGSSQQPSGIFNPIHVTTVKYTPNGDTAWMRFFLTPGSSNESGRHIQLTGDGHLIVAGYSSTTGSLLLFKYTTNGDTIWTRSFSGLNPSEMVLNAAGDIWVTGTDNADMITVHYHADGSYQWDDTFADAGADIDVGTGIDAMGDTAYAVGTGVGVGPNADIVTIRYGPMGTRDWVRRYDGPANIHDGGNRVRVTSANQIYVDGTSQNAVLDNDIVLIKYESNGDSLWSRRFAAAGTGADVANDMALDPSGNVYIGGIVSTSGMNNLAAVIKFNSSGDTVWSRYRGNSISYREIITDASGSVYAHGEGLVTGSFFLDWATQKYTAAGDSAWFRWLLNGLFPVGSNFGRAIASAGGGSVVVAGSINTGAGGSTDMGIAKYVPDCSCPCHGDPVCDSITDVFDVVNAVDIAFRNGTPTVDPGCPRQRTDVAGCDDLTDVFDVVALVDVAFRSGSTSQFCDPCAP